VQKGVHLPPGYYTVWGGEFENQQRAMARLSLIVPLSILLIFVVLFNAFGTVKDAALILLNVPFALHRRDPRALPHRHPPERLGRYRLHRALRPGRLERRGDGQLLQPAAAHRISAHDAALEGSVVRLRTVLMTTMLAMLGLMPMALSHSIGSEVQAPVGGRDHRRLVLGSGADADRAAGAVRDVPRTPRADARGRAITVRSRIEWR